MLQLPREAALTVQMCIHEALPSSGETGSGAGSQQPEHFIPLFPVRSIDQSHHLPRTWTLTQTWEPHTSAKAASRSALHYPQLSNPTVLTPPLPKMMSVSSPPQWSAEVSGLLLCGVHEALEGGLQGHLSRRCSWGRGSRVFQGLWVRNCDRLAGISGLRPSFWSEDLGGLGSCWAQCAPRPAHSQKCLTKPQGLHAHWKIGNVTDSSSSGVLGSRCPFYAAKVAESAEDCISQVSPGSSGSQGALVERDSVRPMTFR